ncbi:MAG: sugar-specific transcriptional regulator TrmB [Haloquadratum walsbyi J07HQW1]|uniref:Sugar-specific transcriptional regulator TrmB n=1 Tax=Haloquadratum walsbyi J07HQW1 TaxID=1238424 RepID=U1N375_9EURY|nr:MAG: sugar-specific transcriptional regulator TrmB [Haloquadratum walsbyi J07HQW1]
MDENRDRNEGGRFEPEHTDKEVIDAVLEHQPAGTQEVADKLSIARQSADYRLRKLLEEGRVSKKKVGNSLVWSATE